MNSHMVLGLFAMYVAIISLIQVLRGQQDAVLSLLRRFWGRRLGHSLYFLSHVAMPLLVCVFSMGWGIRQYDPAAALQQFSGQPQTLRLEIESFQNLPFISPPIPSFDTDRIIYGA